MQTNPENNVVVIKNVVLYDPWQCVSGFVELRTSNDITTIKARHSLVDDLLMSLTHNGKTHTFELASKNQVFELNQEINLEKEILVCIMQKQANQITTLASGMLNPGSEQKLFTNGNRTLLSKPSLGDSQPEISEAIETDDTPTVKTAQLGNIIDETKNGISRENHAEDDRQYKTQVAKEIDQLLRQVCTVDDQNRGICESCPYRDHFFGEGV